VNASLRAPTPILIGVSGHRDLRPEDREALCAAIDTFFARVSARFPHSDLLVLTGLASGADQLVAERANARGCGFVAVLPMPLEAYREDFAPAEREAFEDLLARATAVVELPYGGAHSAATLREDRAARTGQYARLGAYLVANSTILLALWNGKPADAEGGTGDVVAIASGVDERAGPAPYVYQIVTPRARDASTTEAPFTAKPLPPDDPSLDVLEGIDEWNREASALARAAALAAAGSGAHADSEIAPTADAGPRAQAAGAPRAPAEADSHATASAASSAPADADAVRGPEGFAFDGRAVECAFAYADQLAGRDQAKTQRAIDTVYWSALVAGSALVPYGDLGEFFTGYPTIYYSLSLIFLVATLFSIATVLRLHRADVQSSFHDYRALAEGLRVQAAFLEAGLAEDVSERYAAKHRAELAWIRRALAAQYLIARLAPGADAEGPSWKRISDVQSSWVDAQRSYFQRASARNGAAARRLGAWALGWFRISVGAGSLLAIDGALQFGRLPGLASLLHLGTLDVKSVLLALLAWSALLAALAKGRSQLRGYHVQAERYRAMGAVFSAASERLKRLLDTRGDGDLERAAATIAELGEEALAENSEWLLSQRDRPLELVWTG
jgi:hypothetical protein